MKTPREILLARHLPTEPKLDALRNELLDRLEDLRNADPAANGIKPGPHCSLRDSAGSVGVVPGWIECLRSLGWHGAGLAVIWVLILFLNVEHRNASATLPSGDSSRPLFSTLRENRRQILELIASPIVEQASSPPRVLPPRRGQIRSQELEVRVWLREESEQGVIARNPSEFLVSCSTPQAGRRADSFNWALTNFKLAHIS